MKRALLICAFLLSACKDDAQDISPVALSEESVGHYCQMQLLEHDGPKAQVHMQGQPGKPLYFSQVRDAVAYSRLPEQDGVILAMWVNDMGAPGATWTQPGAENWIDATTAHYVVDSSIEGGMGAPELVPFADLDKAADFAAKNGGAVMSLAAIPDRAVMAPVALPGDDASDADYSNRLKALSDKIGG